MCAQTCTVGQPVEDQTTEVTTDFQTQKSKCKRCRYYILGPVIKQYNALNLAWHELTILIRNSAVMRDVLHFAGNNQSVDFCRLREEAGWKLFLPATTTACRASYIVHWRYKDARSCLDIAVLTIVTVYSTARVQLIKPQLAVARLRLHASMMSICLSVCPSVCLSVAKIQKKRQKLSNLELWPF